MSTTAEEHGPYTSSHKLEDQAASTALHMSRDAASSKSSSHPLLDEDGKLSSAGAATSLKYAQAHDLPSFPSQGGVKLSSAKGAASLAESSQKPFEHWKPGTIPAANKAAKLAKDYEMDPLWQPEASAAGSKAAMQSYRDGANVDVYRYGGSKSGHSAAGQAMKMKMPDAITSRDGGTDAHRKALMAATGAYSAARRRADSAPVPPQGDGGWAHKAATSSQKSNLSGAFTTGDPGFEASRIQNMARGNVNRQMYGSAPPVAIEVQEKNRKDMLRASAVAMAQKMYAVQQSIIDEAKTKAEAEQSDAKRAHHRTLSDGSSAVSEEGGPAPQYSNLEEQARKLAQARLAKLHDEHAEYRNYYGQTNSPKSRLSLRGRRRASSDGEFLTDDQKAARKITTQMSIFTSKLAEVDDKKRQTDRDNLMAAAHRNVTATMNSMDEKVFRETGKQSPHQKELWDAEARKRAQADSEGRLANHGKVHIGGGKYLDQSDVDAIARARLQPMLDEISDKAEKQRARDEEIRLEQERIKREAEAEKVRQAEIKAEQKRIAEREKAEEKARKAEERRVLKEAEAANKVKMDAEKERLRQEAAVKKQAETAERDRLRAEAAAEKERLKVQKEAEKEEKRRSKGAGLTGLISGGTAAAGTTTVVEGDEAETQLEGDTVHDQVTNPQTDEIGSSANSVEQPRATEAEPQDAELAKTSKVPQQELETPTSPSKPDSKVKSWFKNRFRTNSKTQKDEEASGFVGGTALSTGVAEETEDPTKSDSEKNVALAGRANDNDSDMYGGAEPTKTTAAPPATRSRSASISSLSSSDYGEPSHEALPEGSVGSDPPRGRRGFKERFLNKIHSKEPLPETPVTATASKAVSGPNEGDDLEEARDTFQEGKLSPPPKIGTVAAEDGPGPTVKTMSPTTGSRERSKFTEEL